MAGSIPHMPQASPRIPATRMLLLDGREGRRVEAQDRRQECLRGPHTCAGRRVVRHVRADREDDPVAGGSTRREQSAQARTGLDRPPPGPGRDRKRHDPRPGGRGGQQRQLDLERVLAAVRVPVHEERGARGQRSRRPARRPPPPRRTARPRRRPPRRRRRRASRHGGWSRGARPPGDRRCRGPRSRRPVAGAVGTAGPRPEAGPCRGRGHAGVDETGMGHQDADRQVRAVRVAGRGRARRPGHRAGRRRPRTGRPRVD